MSTFKKILLSLINLDANRYLFKCTFCKNLEKKKWKKQARTIFSRISVRYRTHYATCLLNSYIYEKKDHFLARTAKYQGFGERLSYSIILHLMNDKDRMMNSTLRTLRTL